MEEKKNVMEFVEDTVEQCEAPASKGLGKALLIVAGLAVGTVGYLRMTKDKREAKAVRKLEKAGYIVTKSDEVTEPDSEEIDE